MYYWEETSISEDIVFSCLLHSVQLLLLLLSAANHGLDGDTRSFPPDGGPPVPACWTLLDLLGLVGPAGCQSRRLLGGSALSAVDDSPGSVALHRVASASCTTALTCLSTNQEAARRLQSCCNRLTSSHLLTGNQPRREQEVTSLFAP